MKPEISLSAPPTPSHWASVLGAPQSPVNDPNSILAWVELDLDAEMRFEKSLLCLIPTGLFWSDGKRSEFWSIISGAHLSHGDHAGVGHLKLESESSLLRLWHFTLAVNPQVLRLQSSFRQLIKGDLAGKEPEASEYDKQVCPVCLSPKPANSDSCPTCDPEEDAPPSTWTLFKLWRFARPYKKQLLLGFVLTLLSTGATLIPPYLTMPLMDHVLIPYEKGNPIADSVNPHLPPGQTLDDWIHQAESANFNVLAGQLSVNLAESTYRGAQALNYPTINLVGTSGYNTSNGTPNNYTPSNTNVYNNTVALQMTIPLVSGGYSSSVIRQNAALVDVAKANYDNYRRTAAQNTRAAFTGFYGGLASVKAYEAAERSTTSALESSKLGFQVGTLINIDVLKALDSLINTRSLLQQARYNTILNAIKLKAHAAALTDEDLIAINALLR